jgi:hypothetical protein
MCLTELSHGDVMFEAGVGWLLGPDLHRLVDAQGFGHTSIAAGVGGSNYESGIAHVGAVVVRATARLLHGYVAVVDEIVKQHVFPFEGEMTAFALGNGNKIVLYADKVNGCARVGRGSARRSGLDLLFVDKETNAEDEEKTDKSEYATHG